MRWAVFAGMRAFPADEVTVAGMGDVSWGVPLSAAACEEERAAWAGDRRAVARLARRAGRRPVPALPQLEATPENAAWARDVLRAVDEAGVLDVRAHLLAAAVCGALAGEDLRRGGYARSQCGRLAARARALLAAGLPSLESGEAARALGEAVTHWLAREWAGAECHGVEGVCTQAATALAPSLDGVPVDVLADLLDAAFYLAVRAWVDGPQEVPFVPAHLRRRHPGAVLGQLYASADPVVGWMLVSRPTAAVIARVDGFDDLAPRWVWDHDRDACLLEGA